MNPKNPDSSNVEILKPSDANISITKNKDGEYNIKVEKLNLMVYDIQVTTSTVSNPVRIDDIFLPLRGLVSNLIKEIKSVAISAKDSVEKKSYFAAYRVNLTDQDTTKKNDEDLKSIADILKIYDKFYSECKEIRIEIMNINDYPYLPIDGIIKKIDDLKSRLEPARDMRYVIMAKGDQKINEKVNSFHEGAMREYGEIIRFKALLRKISHLQSYSFTYPDIYRDNTTKRIIVSAVPKTGFSGFPSFYVEKEIPPKPDWYALSEISVYRTVDARVPRVGERYITQDSSVFENQKKNEFGVVNNLHVGYRFGDIGVHGGVGIGTPITELDLRVSFGLGINIGFPHAFSLNLLGILGYGEQLKNGAENVRTTVADVKKREIFFAPALSFGYSFYL